MSSRSFHTSQTLELRTRFKSRSQPVEIPNLTYTTGGTFSTRLSHGWTKYVHLTGSVYYYHSDFRLVTPDNIEDEEKRRAVLQSRREFLDLLQEERLLGLIPGECDLVIWDAYDEDKTCCLFLYHKQRKQFECPSEGPGTS